MGKARVVSDADELRVEGGGDAGKLEDVAGKVEKGWIVTESFESQFEERVIYEIVASECGKEQQIRLRWVLGVSHEKPLSAQTRVECTESMVVRTRFRLHHSIVC